MTIINQLNINSFNFRFKWTYRFMAKKNTNVHFRKF